MRQRLSVRALRRLVPLAVIAGALAAPSAASAGGPVDPTLNVSDDSVVEHDGAQIWFDVNRSPNTGSSTAQYSIAPGSATAGVDYGTPFDDDANPNDGVLTWPTPGGAGDQTIRVTVPVVNDSLFEADEDLFLNLGTVNDSIVGDGQGRGVIVNDDPAPPPPATTTPPCMQLACLALPPSLVSLFGPNFAAQLQAWLSGGGGLFGMTGLFPLLGNFNSLITAALGGLGKKSAAAPIATASKTITQTGAQSVTYTLTKQGKKLRKQRKANLTVTMTFTDITGKTVTDSVQVPFKNKKKRGKK